MVTTRTLLDMFDVSLEFLTEVVQANPSLRGAIIGYLAERKLWEQLWPADESKRRITAIRKDDDHDRDNKGDLVVTYKGVPFRIEVKSLQTNSIEMFDDASKKWIKKVLKTPLPKVEGQKRRKNRWQESELYRTIWKAGDSASRFRGKIQCDASDRRDVTLPTGERVNTTCLKVGEFDVLAMGLYAFRESWDFGYILNQNLPRTTSKKYSAEVRPHLLKTLIPTAMPLPKHCTDDLFTLLDQLVEAKRSKKS